MSIPALFAAQATRTPEVVAVSCAGGLSLTYRELDEASNRFAHLLVAQGAGPGRCVAGVGAAVGGGDRGDCGGAQVGGGVCAD